jgi:hypothetical protein
MTNNKERIPKTCEECIKSRYKLPKPDCAYEQGLEHKKTYSYFKKTYDTTVTQHLDEMQKLKRKREQCLSQIKTQASKMLALKRALNIDGIMDTINNLNERIDDIEENGAPTDDLQEHNRILSPHKTEPNAYEKKVVNRSKKDKPKKEKSKKKIPLKDRGWLMYVRNTKKENVDKYIERLKEEHPEVTDNQIKVSINAAGNYMIRYTNNPDMA